MLIMSSALLSISALIDVSHQATHEARRVIDTASISDRQFRVLTFIFIIIINYELLTTPSSSTTS